MLGADFEPDGGYFRITKIYPGENWNDATRSPLTEPGLKVKAGNYLIAVDGQEAHSNQGSMLTSRTSQENSSL